MTTPRSNTNPLHVLDTIREGLRREIEAERAAGGAAGAGAEVGRRTLELLDELNRGAVIDREENRILLRELRAQQRSFDRARAEQFGGAGSRPEGMSDRPEVMGRMRPPAARNVAAMFQETLSAAVETERRRVREEARGLFGDIFRQVGPRGATGRPSLVGTMAGRTWQPRSITAGATEAPPLRRPEDFSQIAIDRYTSIQAQQAEQMSRFMSDTWRLQDELARLSRIPGIQGAGGVAGGGAGATETVGITDEEINKIREELAQKDVRESKGNLDIETARLMFRNYVRVPQGATIPKGWDIKGRATGASDNPYDESFVAVTATARETIVFVDSVETAMKQMGDAAQSAAKATEAAAGATEETTKVERTATQQEKEAFEDTKKRLAERAKIEQRMVAEQRDNQRRLQAERGLQSAARDREIQEQRRDPRLATFEARHTRPLRRFDTDIMPPWAGTVPQDTGFGGFDWLMRPRRHFQDVPYLAGDSRDPNSISWRSPASMARAAARGVFRRPFGMSINDTRLAGRQFDRIQGSGFGRHAGQIELDELNMQFPRLDAASHAAMQFSETTVKLKRDWDRRTAELEREQPTETRTQEDIDRAKERLANEREKWITARNAEQESLNQERDNRRNRLSDLQSGVQLQEQNNRKAAQALAKRREAWQGLLKTGQVFAAVLGGMVAAGAIMGRQWTSLALEMRNAAASSELIASEMLHISTGFQEVTGIRVAAEELRNFEKAQRSIVAGFLYGEAPSVRQIQAYNMLGKSIGDASALTEEQYERLRKMPLAYRESVAEITKIPEAMLVAANANYSWNEVQGHGIRQTEEQMQQNAELSLQLTRLTNDFRKLAGEVGVPVLDALIKLKTGLMPVVEGVARWVGNNPKLVAGIATFAVVLGALIPLITMAATVMTALSAAATVVGWPVALGILLGGGLAMVGGATAAAAVLSSNMEDALKGIGDISKDIEDPVRKGTTQGITDFVNEKQTETGRYSGMTTEARLQMAYSQSGVENVLAPMSGQDQAPGTESEKKAHKDPSRVVPGGLSGVPGTSMLGPRPTLGLPSLPQVSMLDEQGEYQGVLPFLGRALQAVLPGGGGPPELWPGEGRGGYAVSPPAAPAPTVADDAPMPDEGGGMAQRFDNLSIVNYIYGITDVDGLAGALGDSVDQALESNRN